MLLPRCGSGAGPSPCTPKRANPARFGAPRAPAHQGSQLEVRDGHVVNVKSCRENSLKRLICGKQCLGLSTCPHALALVRVAVKMTGLGGVSHMPSLRIGGQSVRTG
jgi:hypothetical protein